MTKPEKILGLLVLFAGFGIQAAQRRGLPSDLKNVAVTAGLSALWGLCVFGCWLAVKAALILHKEDIKEYNDYLPRLEYVGDPPPRRPPSRWRAAAAPVVLCIIFIVSIVFSTRYIPVPPLEEPSFYEKGGDTMTFSIGRGIGRQMTAEELRQKRPLDLQFDNSVLPISLYADGDVLYADITVAGEDGTPTIELRKNQFTVQHDGWDKNSNKNAIEVINSQSRVVFQLIRESRSSVRLKGAFPIRDGVVIADDTHLVVGHAANECNIKPIFKYPAWKYPGRYVEDYEQPKINEHIPPLPPHRARSPHGRSLADWQNVRLVSVLSRYPRQKVMVLASLGEETWSYAEDFRDVFISSKWAVEGPIPAPIDQPAMDLQLSLAYQLFSAKDLPMPCVALRATLDFLKLKSSRKFVFDPDVPIDKIVLWVGAKSPDTANPNLFPPLGLRRR